MEMSPQEIHQKLMALGVSDLDAGLVVNCISKKSAYTWLNTDPISKEQVQNINDFITSNEMEVKVEVSEVPYQGKFIWDIKVARKSIQIETPPAAQAQQEMSPERAKKLGPEGRFKSLSELGL
jgi:hypothetical protein